VSVYTIYTMKTLIIGIGNTLYGDDGIGIYIARELQNRLKDKPDIVIEEASVGGINLMELMIGFNRAIVIDAIQLRENSPGYIYRLNTDSMVNTRHANSPHDTDFITALEVGRKLNLTLPESIIVYGVEVENIDPFVEDCTPKVKDAIPTCVNMIIQELEHRGN
jgi:hydrogenase maturation protease